MAFEAWLNFKIGWEIQREVAIPAKIAITNATKHKIIVKRLLALISSIKSRSGITTTINQSSPRPSLKGKTWINCRWLFSRNSVCTGLSKLAKLPYWWISCWVAPRIKGFWLSVAGRSLACFPSPTVRVSSVELESNWPVRSLTKAIPDFPIAKLDRNLRKSSGSKTSVAQTPSSSSVSGL